MGLLSDCVVELTTMFHMLSVFTLVGHPFNNVTGTSVSDVETFTCLYPGMCGMRLEQFVAMRKMPKGSKY